MYFININEFYLYFELRRVINRNFSRSNPLDVLVENYLYVSSFYLLRRMSLNMFILIQRRRYNRKEFEICRYHQATEVIVVGEIKIRHSFKISLCLYNDVHDTWAWQRMTVTETKKLQQGSTHHHHHLYCGLDWLHITKDLISCVKTYKLIQMCHLLLPKTLFFFNLNTF